MPFIVAMDYDGTLFEGSYPSIGAPKDDVIEKVKELQEYGAEIALWTCREGIALEEALYRFEQLDLEFDSINENTPSQIEFMRQTWDESKGEKFCSRKIMADIYVDDKAPGSIEYFLKIDAKATCENFEHRSLEPRNPTTK